LTSKENEAAEKRDALHAEILRLEQKYQEAKNEMDKIHVNLELVRKKSLILMTSLYIWL